MEQILSFQSRSLFRQEKNFEKVASLENVSIHLNDFIIPLNDFIIHLYGFIKGKSKIDKELVLCQLMEIIENLLDKPSIGSYRLIIFTINYLKFYF